MLEIIEADYHGRKGGLRNCNGVAHQIVVYVVKQNEHVKKGVHYVDNRKRNNWKKLLARIMKNQIRKKKNRNIAKLKKMEKEEAKWKQNYAARADHDRTIS